MPDTFELKRGGKHVVTIRKVTGLAEQLLAADEKQFAILFPKVKDRGEQGQQVLNGESTAHCRPMRRRTQRYSIAKFMPSTITGVREALAKSA